jgi:hypothetical protein
MKAEAIENVRTAVRQLEFAIKLLSYCELGNINPADFDLPHAGAVSLGEGNFSDTDSIERAANIGVLIAMGAAALVLEDAFESAGIKADLKANDDIGQLRILVRMIRCAYAHSFADPRWKVRGDYCRTLDFDLNGTHILIDLQKLHGQPIKLEDHIEDYPNGLSRICEKSLQVITAAP